MSKLDELIRELCPDGVEYKTLGEMGKFYGGLTGKSKKDFENGNEVFITYKNVYLNPALDIYPNDKVKIADGEKQRTLEYGDIIFTGSSETPDECGFSSVVTRKTDKKLYLNSFCFFFRLNNPKVLLPDFSKHLFRSSKLRFQIGKTASGVTRYNVSKDKMAKVEIPLPPLEVQCEIVRILDDYTENVTELQRQLVAEMTARKTQYSFYRDKLLTFNTPVEWKPMEEEFPFIRNGFVGTVTPYFTSKEQGVRYLEGTNIHDGVISDNEIVYVSKEFHQKHSRNELKDGDILMVQSGHVGECAVVDDKYAGSNCHALIIMSNAGRCNSRFVMHYLRSTEGKARLKKITTGGTVKHILASNMKKFMIPVPPLDVQNRIVNVLDNFEKTCSDLNIGLPAEIEARQKQYEYYRDKLLNFKEHEDGLSN